MCVLPTYRGKLNASTSGRSYLAFALVMILGWGVAPAQDLEQGWKSWQFQNLSIKLNKQLTLKAGMMLSFNPGPFRFSFLQSTAGVTYRLNNKKYYVGGGYNTIYFRRGNEGRNTFHRLYAYGSRKGKLFGLSTRHRVKIQWYIPRVEKYLLRGVYDYKIYFKNKFLPWKATPYIANEFMYYFGGKPILYFDESGEIMDFQSPNGFHRWRLSVGVSAKPLPYMSVSAFYKTQREFNTGLFPSRELNVQRPFSRNTTYAFNNYWVWGMSFSFTLRP